MVIPLALLTACGGGGGKGSSLPPATTPQTKKSGEATFSFKLPGKSTMTKLRRRYYQSQATQGVAIDWTSSNPYAPDYSAPITAGCPTPTLGNPNLPPGVASCTVDANGNTDYTFQLQIPAGTYPTFTVTTFDQAPASGGTFVSAANMLAQGQLAAPVVITAGETNTVPSLTFYGIPASVSFVPGPAQSHVTTYGGNIAVIGNAPQNFFAQAVDADGFVIDSTDGSAPAVTLAESASDSPQEFTVATTATPYEYTLTAKNAFANATIDLTATPGGTGLSPIVDAVTVTPVQELWTTQEAGSYPNGIYGYPLYPGASVAGPVDGYADPVGNALCGGGGSSCNLDTAAIDPTSGTIYAVGINSSSIPAIYAFTQGAGSAGLIPPSAASYTGAAGDTFEAIAIDTNHHGFIVDNNSGNVALEAYSTSSGGWSSLTTSNDSNLTTLTAESLAIAPTAANVPSSLVGSLWLGTSASVFLVYPAFSGAFSPSVEATAPTISAQVLGFDSAGYLWMSDGTNVYINKVSGTASSPVITQIAQVGLVSSGAGGTSFGAAAGQNMWFGQGTGEETGYDLYTASSCNSSCTLSASGDELSTNASSFAAFVTP